MATETTNNNVSPKNPAPTVPSSIPTPSISDEKITGMVERVKTDRNVRLSLADGIKDIVNRNLIIVGTGDGGCNIAQEINKACPDTYFVVYNTSARGMDKLNADVIIIPQEEDGSGKVRSYSKEVFCSANGYAQELLQAISSLADKINNLEYILVTTTADGGTGGGVSPMIAKFLNDNMDIPVIILGVYPSLTEDATAMFNALQWQSEVEKTGCPYIILDNNDPDVSFKLQVHQKVNAQAAQMVKILTGEMFGPTNISAIDNRDMYMLLKHIGGRICIYGQEGKPPVGKSIDEYIMDMIQYTNSPAPNEVEGIGLFIKGPETFVKNADTSLTKICATYGNAAIRYFHLEVSDDPYIAIIMTGNSEPTDRLMIMKQRYDEIMNNIKKTASSVTDIMSDMNNPLSKPEKKTAPKNMDLSALDFFKE